MDNFDKRMALEVIEDALTGMDTPEDHGFAVGLCGAFYMCGLLEEGNACAAATDSCGPYPAVQAVREGAMRGRAGSLSQPAQG